jgi:hypothetical protein
LFLFFLTKGSLLPSKETIDFHFYDTYYVIPKVHFYLLLFLFISTFSFIGGTIRTRFKNKGFLIGMVTLIAVDIYMFVRIFFYH